MTDLSPERLFLEPNCCVDPRQGRMWCEDDVWPDCGSHEEGGVEYVRADLARQRIADAKRIAELEAVTTKQDMIEELEGRIDALPDIEEKDLDLKYLLRLILDLLR